LTLKWRFGDGQSFWESERPLRDAGSSQEGWQVSLWALNRCLQTKAARSPKDSTPSSWFAKLSAVHAGGEFGCEIRSLGRVRKAPKGSGDPRNGWDCQTGVRQRVYGRDPARAGANRGAPGNQRPNGLDERLTGHRRSRSGASTLKWRSGDGQSFQESERPLRDAGSKLENRQVRPAALNRCFQTKATGSRGNSTG